MKSINNCTTVEHDKKRNKIIVRKSVGLNNKQILSNEYREGF